MLCCVHCTTVHNSEEPSANILILDPSHKCFQYNLISSGKSQVSNVPSWRKFKKLSIFCVTHRPLPSRASNEGSRRLREVLQSRRRPLLVLVRGFNQVKALVGIFSVIVKLRVIFEKVRLKLYSPGSASHSHQPHPPSKLLTLPRFRFR